MKTCIKLYNTFFQFEGKELWNRYLLIESAAICVTVGQQAVNQQCCVHVCPELSQAPNNPPSVDL